MKMANARMLIGLGLVLAAGAGACGGGSSAARAPAEGNFAGEESAGGATGPGQSGAAPGSGGAPGSSTTGGSSAGGAGGMGAPAPGSFGNVGVSGAQDFGVFRRALEQGRVPSRESIDAAGFFAEHFTSLPPPTCGKSFCLHALLSVSKDLARGGPLTLLQMGMNSTIDPATVPKPPLNLAVVLDHSGSMAAAGKMDFAKEGVKLLIDALGPTDTFTLVIFDDKVKRVFGPGRVTDKETLKGMVSEIQPAGGTNIHDGLEGGYKAVLATPNENEQRRVIFLTDGLPTAGNTSVTAIRAMSDGYNQKYVGLTTIGLGGDVNVPLLRGLAEGGGGNFYFVEKAAAVREVFTEELRFFVAPIAYDLELIFNELPGYSLKQVHGTSLWSPIAGGGKVNVPSVFLVSRTTTAPGANGGRRGGGSAIMAELARAITAAPPRPEPVGKLTLKYRLPGSTVVETQETEVTYAPGTGGPAPEVPDYYSDKAVEKNTLILNFFFAFRDATTYAPSDPRRALDLLTAFQARIQPRLAEWTDEDLKDDLALLQRFIDVLKAGGTARP